MCDKGPTGDLGVSRGFIKLGEVFDLITDAMSSKEMEEVTPRDLSAIRRFCNSSANILKHIADASYDLENIMDQAAEIKRELHPEALEKMHDEEHTHYLTQKIQHAKEDIKGYEKILEELRNKYDKPASSD